MDVETIDREMAHVILSAFTVASFEGMSSLNANLKPKKDKPLGPDFVRAETNVLKLLNSLFPDVVSQYFDAKKRII